MRITKYGNAPQRKQNEKQHRGIKTSINARTPTKGLASKQFPPILLAHRSIKQHNTQMFGYKGLNSCHRLSVYMGLLTLSKQLFHTRWMTDLEWTKIPTLALAKHATKKQKKKPLRNGLCFQNTFWLNNRMVGIPPTTAAPGSKSEAGEIIPLQ